MKTGIHAEDSGRFRLCNLTPTQLNMLRAVIELTTHEEVVKELVWGSEEQTKELGAVLAEIVAYLWEEGVSSQACDILDRVAPWEYQQAMKQIELIPRFAEMINRVIARPKTTPAQLHHFMWMFLRKLERRYDPLILVAQVFTHLPELLKLSDELVEKFDPMGFLIELSHDYLILKHRTRQAFLFFNPLRSQRKFELTPTATRLS